MSVIVDLDVPWWLILDGVWVASPRWHLVMKLRIAARARRQRLMAEVADRLRGSRVLAGELLEPQRRT